jgi:hypothetical protein
VGRKKRSGRGRQGEETRSTEISTALHSGFAKLGFMYLRSPDHVIAAQCDSLTVKLSLSSESTLVL